VTALTVFSAGVCVFCAAGLVGATDATRLDPFFDDFRYATPLHYPNATAALAVMGMWPALILSARREIPGWMRVALLGMAVFLTEFAFLPQSRGALLGLVLVAPVVLLLSAQRIGLLIRMLVVGGGVAFTLPLTLRVDHAVNAGRPVSPALRHAADAMLLTSLAALAIGALLVLAESRSGPSARRQPRPGPRWRRRIGLRGRAASMLAILAVVTASGFIIAPAVGHTVRSIVRKGQVDSSSGGTHLLSTTPEERLDLYGVSVHLFDSAPVLGVGAGNFGLRYDALRRFSKHSQYAHDLPLRVLSETGLLGLALFAAIIFALAVGLIRRARGRAGPERACAVVALALAAYFLIHASVDWLDEFPALAVPALAFSLAAIVARTRAAAASQDANAAQSAGGAAASDARRLSRSSATRSRRIALVRRAGSVTVVAAVGVALAVALGAPYLENVYVQRAFATYRAHPATAYGELARAASIDPLSADPLVSEGTIAVNLGDLSRARSAFRQADRREGSWYSRIELALLDAHAGRFGAASSELSRAALLDRDDPVLGRAKLLVGRRTRIDPHSFNEGFVEGPVADLFRQQNLR
jgi:O-Antigen ligase